MDEKKITAGYHNRDKNIHIDVKPFEVLAQPGFRDIPVVICVAMYRTGGKLERNVKSINRVEGIDLWHFN